MALLSSGCATMTEINAGPVVALPTQEDASFGGGIAAHAAVGSSNEHTNAMTGTDASIRAKLTESTQHIAFSDGLLFARGIGAKGEVIVRGGLSLAFERFDDTLLVGLGPFATLAGGLTLDEDVYYVPGQIFAHWRRDRTFLTFGPMAEIDARLTRPSAIGFVGLSIGIAWASEVVSAPPPVYPLQ